MLGVSMSRPPASDWMSPWKPTGSLSNSNAPGRLSYLKRVLAAAVKEKTLHRQLEKNRNSKDADTYPL